MTKERVFRREYAKELLSVAKADLESAEILAKGDPRRKENIFFLCQQSLEKSLKAGLCWLGLPVPLVHDLNLIVDRFPRDLTPPLSAEIGDLTQFATVRRYEESVAFYTEEEIAAALAGTSQVINWVEHIFSARP